MVNFSKRLYRIDDRGIIHRVDVKSLSLKRLDKRVKEFMALGYREF